MSLSSILTDTFGFYTIGTFLSAILLGVTCSQGFIVLLVHLSYAMRIYHVSGKKKLLPFAITVISFGNLALGWALVAVLFRERLVSQLPGLPETIARDAAGSGHHGRSAYTPSTLPNMPCLLRL
ncbi:hypothetical protein GALMADRAFT_146585 [Galerina marginata CBS 339.88]|uniref:Uncharacterized protein n=1 Tax=Galerina marginata (strain CBS 339.88) TaxID=685588 RepID=A0A067SMV5_GALM3|nr:hypothetical protein GALMADRAFT_146585 [Galerina marginata CBS 339.88]